jgi:hypothetical protein
VSTFGTRSSSRVSSEAKAIKRVGKLRKVVLEADKENCEENCGIIQPPTKEQVCVFVALGICLQHTGASLIKLVHVLYSANLSCSPPSGKRSLTLVATGNLKSPCPPFLLWADPMHSCKQWEPIEGMGLFPAAKMFVGCSGFVSVAAKGSGAVLVAVPSPPYQN